MSAVNHVYEQPESMQTYLGLCPENPELEEAKWGDEGSLGPRSRSYFEASSLETFPFEAFINLFEIRRGRGDTVNINCRIQDFSPGGDPVFYGGASKYAYKYTFDQFKAILLLKKLIIVDILYIFLSYLGWNMPNRRRRRRRCLQRPSCSRLSQYFSASAFPLSWNFEL
jgi:hypothetical protein